MLRAVAALGPGGYPLASGPMFLAFNSATVANQTGAGNVVTFPFDTEVFDVTGSFASSTFTAPVTGKYMLSANVMLDSVTSAMTTGQIRLVTSNRTTTSFFNPATIRDSNNISLATVTGLFDMDAADTALIQVVAANGAGATAGLYGASTPRSFFSGYLVA